MGHRDEWVLFNPEFLSVVDSYSLYSIQRVGRHITLMMKCLYRVEEEEIMGGGGIGKK